MRSDELVPVGPQNAGSVLPGVIDHHVHLGLSDLAQLAGSAVVEVHDLGWEPAAVAQWMGHPPGGLTVRACGRFHTAVGGYPSGREWAPAASVREVLDAVDAPAAVAEALAADSSAIKITLHAAMPLLDDETLHALVAAARAVGLPTVVHAEGSGQAARAIAVGADALAHTPWTERLDAAALRHAAERQMVWLSSLAIHTGDDLTVALDNARGFLDAGGQLRYGTDMGNGPTPAGGVNTREIELLGEAGLAGETLITAVCGPDREIAASRALWSPHPPPRTAADLIHWLVDATRLHQAAGHAQ